MPRLNLTLPACPDCCDPCAFGDTLHVLFSGQTQNPLTSGCQAPGGGFGTNSYQINSFSIGGPYALSGTNPTWTGTGGSYDIDVFPGTYFCDVASTNYTGTFNLSVACLDGVLAVQAFTDQAIGVFGVFYVFYAQGGTINVALSNAGSSGLGFDISVNGTATVSKP